MKKGVKNWEGHGEGILYFRGEKFSGLGRKWRVCQDWVVEATQRYWSWGVSLPPPSLNILVLGGPDPPPSMKHLVLGGLDPPLATHM